jgi:asparagine synthase (glutamine-hydrolysing)
VVLAAYAAWGPACLDRFVGMFAFVVWDEHEQRLFAARDRYGVKPLRYHVTPGGTLVLASEDRGLLAGGVSDAPDEATWATYLASGRSDHDERTFFAAISSLPAGHHLTWEEGRHRVARWYDPAAATAEPDDRSDDAVAEEYLALLVDSVRLRFRADVPVGINLSGGLDSSLLLGLVEDVGADGGEVGAFTFATGDPDYDELPWVRRMVERTQHPLEVATLAPSDVPDLARSVHAHQRAPFGGIPTLAYARLFERARRQGVTVLLDGQGLDEQWAGYDYHLTASSAADAPVVQGATDPALRPECLRPEFRALAPAPEDPSPYPDPLRNLQHRDLTVTKIPRALRFNDLASMRSSIELREPFLDHRLVELAFRQPAARKVRDGQGKWLVRRLAHQLVPPEVRLAPKRPVQTPQREWLRGPLRGWATDLIETALSGAGSWLDPAGVRAGWRAFVEGDSDNSFFAWQWLSVGLALDARAVAA